MKTCKLPCSPYIIVLALAILNVLPPVDEGFCGVGAADVEPGVALALLAQEWSVVREKCGSSEELATFPVLKAIKGHACLMLNHNNESLGLFMTLASRSDREAWKSWSQAFALRSPKSPVAHYLLGDALARLDDFDGAVAAFEESVRLAKVQGSSPHGSLNALGVVHSARRQWDKAEPCFKEALRINPGFADAHASLGTMSLHRSRLKDAFMAYHQATSISKDFTLGLNGSACVKFLDGPKHWDQARKDFAAAGEQMGLPVIAFNADLMNQAAFDTASKSNLYFHEPNDFKDWKRLQELVRDGSSIFGKYFNDTLLTRENPKLIIDRMNEIMDDPSFYDSNIGILDKHFTQNKNDLFVANMKALIDDTKDFRLQQNSQLNVYEKGAIRGLNRGLMSLCYPDLIREAGSTKAGMSLTLNGGIASDGYSYKQGLNTSTLLARKNGMEYTYRPIATALEQVPIPIVAGAAKMWNQHLDASLGQTNSILEQRGISANQIKTGGLSTEELMVLFFKRDTWKPVNWYGLLYNVAPEGT